MHTTVEGLEIENLFISLGLSQIIYEPTNFEPNKKTAIDLIITDQPNLTLDSRTYTPLDPYCHHQIIYFKVNFRILHHLKGKFGTSIEQIQLP